MTGWSDGSEMLLEITESQLSVTRTLDCGQAFRWRARPDGWWAGVVRGRAVRLRREEGGLRVQVYPALSNLVLFISEYFRLDVDLTALDFRFASADPWMASAVSAFSGLRVLGQEPQETLLSYVCSTANSVPRIAKAVAEMSRRWGAFIGSLDGEDYYAFPEAHRLAGAPAEELWTGCGLGWRGSNLKAVAGQLAAYPEGWPEQLRALPYAEAKAKLMELRGVGAKIADCVCLFSLGNDEAVPVDTHIWAVAKEIFDAHIPTRTLTPGTYEAVARLFVDRYGEYAGWAQEYLYLQRRAAQGRVSTEPRSQHAL